VSPILQHLLIVSSFAALAGACDPNVVIGARWSLEQAAGAGQGGAPEQGPAWCATAPWVNNPARFISDDGEAIPPGSYVITYMSGAQIHDLNIGYEVTRHYYIKGTFEAGHHIFSGESPETGATSLWLDQEGIGGFGGTIPEVEAANRGHTWSLEHAGGELSITLYDDDYHDNSGPGSRFCITAAPP
jgi:hypothetical protein